MTIVRRNYSATTYLKRKKVLPTNPSPRPKYEEGTLRPHTKPVEMPPHLAEVDSPGTRVRTES